MGRKWGGAMPEPAAMGLVLVGLLAAGAAYNWFEQPKPETKDINQL